MNYTKQDILDMFNAAYGVLQNNIADPGTRDEAISRIRDAKNKILLKEIHSPKEREEEERRLNALNELEGVLDKHWEKHGEQIVRLVEKRKTGKST